MFRAEEVHELISQKHVHISNHFHWHNFPIKQNPSVNLSHDLGSCWLTSVVKSEGPAANYYFSSNTNDKQNLVIYAVLDCLL